MVREHIKRRVRSWLQTLALAIVVLAIFQLAGIKPGDGTLVSIVLGNKWVGLLLLVLFAECENWTGWKQGREDQHAEDVRNLAAKLRDAEADHACR